LSDVSGTVSEIKTSKGGADVILKVDTPFGSFTNNDIFQRKNLFHGARDIKKGAALYGAIGALDVGAAVRISVTDVLAEESFSEEDSLCGDRWLVKYTKVEALK
jgi:hypothetical protein